MTFTAIVPIVTTDRLRETRAFYVDVLGFELAFDSDHYLGVRAGPRGAPELGFMSPDADAPHRFEGRGITYSLVVDDADREHARLKEAGVAILAAPTDQPWGMRMFVALDPNGVAIVIGHPIQPAAEFAASMR